MSDIIDLMQFLALFHPTSSRFTAHNQCVGCFSTSSGFCYLVIVFFPFIALLVRMISDTK